MKLIKVENTSEGNVVDIFSAAFADDPVMHWLCPQPEFVPAFFSTILPAFLSHGLSYVERDGRGAASWLGPRAVLKWPFSLTNIVKIVRISGFRTLYRLLRSGAQTEKYHPSQPHYYLFAIAAIPSSQGQGVGSLLMSHMLRRCDSELMPAYLENSRQANLAFYQGHGFEVIKELHFAKGAPPVWLMWREPRPVVS
jgi:ribosomal protein S18 acetylase RimI-like enzyme